MKTRIRSIFENVNFKFLAVFLIFLIGLMIYAFLHSSVKSDTYEVELFQLSEETIRSPKTVEDPVKTELERERAASEVPPSYQFIDEIAGNQSAVIESLFGFILDAKDTEADAESDTRDMGEMVAELQENLRLMENEENGLRLTDEMLRSLLSLSDTQLVLLQKTLKEAVENALENPVRVSDLDKKRNEVERYIRSNDDVPSSVLQAAVSIGRFGIIPNEVVNKELTETQLQQAKASIEPTRILQGQVLVQEGEVIDRETYRQLELVGLAEEQEDIKPYLGLLLFVLISIGLLSLVLQKSYEEERQKMKALLVIATVVFISLALMKLINLVSGNFEVVIAFLFPTAMAGMIIRLLVNEKSAILSTFLISAYAGIILHEDYTASLQMDVVLYILFGGITGIYLIERDDRRARLLQTSLAVATVNILFIGFYLLISQSQFNLDEVWFYIAAAVVSGFLSGALTIGLLPFFESALGLLSTLKLIELSNPNHPLLKKILIETPGTYHHSVMVANLADASCEAIGANGLLARVGCYYHDIGKTKRPQYFIENQVNIANPHDSLPPETSRDIILAHGKQGAEMLKKHKMPREIVDIAAQHHGTSLLKFFYFKAKEKDPEVREEEYRYEGPKPQTKEIAIISIADSIEAAVRSMKEPTSEKIKKLVDAIVEDKLKDGQFDECDLTMKELKTVKNVICETLNGIFHSRIEYPTEKE